MVYRFFALATFFLKTARAHPFKPPATLPTPTKHHHNHTNPRRALCTPPRVSLSRSLNHSPNVGHTIEMGDKFIDYSAATQLKKLTALLGIGV